MNVRGIRRGSLAALSLALTLGAAAAGARAGTKDADPSQVVPLDRLAPALRDSVTEVIAEPTFHHKGTPDTFPCQPKIYQALLYEPVLTLGLWHDIATTPARLWQVGPEKFEGTDGAGTTASWEYAYKSPRLNVMLCTLEHATPRGNAKLNGRIVLVVHSAYFRESGGDFWIKHDVEAFVKIDSRGWKAVARTFRPLIEKLLEEQVQEGGLFVSLMGRLVVSYPTWASGVCMKQDGVAMPVRTGFRDLVMQSRRPDASPGRPQLVENPPAAATIRR